MKEAGAPASVPKKRAARKRSARPRPDSKRPAPSQRQTARSPRPKPADKPVALAPLPYVIVNMSMTADGKTASEKRGVRSFGSALDRENLLELRATADAVLAGARTVDSDAITLGPGAAKFRQTRLQAGLREYNLRIVVSGAGTIDERAEVFRQKFSPVIVLTTERISHIRLKELSAVAEQLKIFGCNDIDFVAALRWLRAHWGVNRLLVEGGGDLNFAFFRAELVDELHLTVCPFLLGGREAPTIADGLGIERLPKAARFELHSMKRAGDEIFLVYRKNTRPRLRGVPPSARAPDEEFEPAAST
jgi:riboflavin-specific deaminase-like protein